MRIRTTFFTLAFAASLLGTVPALAQSAQPVVVDVEASAADVSPPAETRAAVAQQLRAPVVAPDQAVPADTRGTITVAADGEGHLVITYRDTAGRQIFRVVAVPGDPVAAVATVALIAGNLARRDADELIAQLRTAQAPPRPTPPPVPQPIVVVPATVPTMGVAPPVAPQATPENRALAHPLSIGGEAYLSTVPAPGNGVNVIGASGAALTYTIASHFALGVSNMTYTGVSLANGTRWGISAGPVVEAFTFLAPWVQPFAQVGLPLQERWGAGVPMSTGVAVFAGAGVRLWIGGHVSFGLGVRAYAVAGDGYAFESQVLPQGAVVLSGGCELAMHF